MGNQRHDIGWKKRQPRSNSIAIPNTDTLAQNLVRRGLASVAILEVRASFPHATNPRQDRT